jgi:signal transduction histidine kinase
MRIVLFYIMLLVSGTVAAQMNAILFLEDDFTVVNASSVVSNFGDATCEMTIDDILMQWNEGAFTTFRKKSNIGFTQVCVWMEFQLMNTSEEPKQLFIEIPNPDLEGIEFYIFNQDLELKKKVLTGSKYRFSKREVQHRNFLFQLEAKPLETYAVFMRVDQQANYVNVPIRVSEVEYKIAQNHKGEYRFGIFCGVMLLYLFVMTIISTFLNDKYYLYYTFLLGLGFFFIFLNEGFAFQYLYPNHPWLQNVVRYTILNTYMLVSIIFLERFIRDKLPSKIVFYILKGGMAFLVLVTLVILFLPIVSLLIQFRVSILLSILVILINLFIFILLVVIYIKTKQRSIISLIAAYIVAFFIILFFTSIKFGLLPINIDSSGAIYVGIAVVGVIFTILFSFRIYDVIIDNKRLRTELSMAGIRSSFALLEGQEKERKRVADELHDGIGIKMSALKMKLSTLTKEDSKTQEIIDKVDQTCIDIRSLSHSLVPKSLERYGLSVAIHDLIQELHRQHKTKIIFNQKRLAENIDAVSKLAIYRLIEGILNELVRRNIEQVTFKLVIIPSIQQASINMNYIGRRVEFGINRNLEDVRSIIKVLNGQVRWTMDTMWANQLDIDIPIISLTKENRVEEE